MRKTKEVLRLRFELGQPQIARSCGMGLGRVHLATQHRTRRNHETPPDSRPMKVAKNSQRGDVLGRPS
jgi:hypothetical protein